MPGAIVSNGLCGGQRGHRPARAELSPWKEGTASAKARRLDHAWCVGRKAEAPGGHRKRLEWGKRGAEWEMVGTER